MPNGKTLIGIRQSGKSTGYKSGLSRQLSKRLQRSKTTSVSSDTFLYAKALAVKRVVTNDGRKTPGVDGVLWNTPAKKMKAVLSLTDKGYRARPLRRVYIEKKDKKKKRPLGIPTMYDRAMQALYALALEPVAETTADGKSFGFRKEDAHRMPANICSMHCRASTFLRSGFGG